MRPSLHKWGGGGCLAGHLPHHALPPPRAPKQSMRRNPCARHTRTSMRGRLYPSSWQPTYSLRPEVDAALSAASCPSTSMPLASAAAAAAAAPPVTPASCRAAWGGGVSSVRAVGARRGRRSQPGAGVCLLLALVLQAAMRARGVAVGGNSSSSAPAAAAAARTTAPTAHSPRGTRPWGCRRPHSLLCTASCPGPPPPR
jgi:hypothetical protein